MDKYKITCTSILLDHIKEKLTFFSHGCCHWRALSNILVKQIDRVYRMKFNLLLDSTLRSASLPYVEDFASSHNLATNGLNTLLLSTFICNAHLSIKTGKQFPFCTKPKQSSSAKLWCKSVLWIFLSEIVTNSLKGIYFLWEYLPANPEWTFQLLCHLLDSW